MPARQTFAGYAIGYDRGQSLAVAALTSILIPSRIQHHCTDPAAMESYDCVVPLVQPDQLQISERLSPCATSLSR